MLKINDLADSREMDRAAMAGVTGGNSELEQLSALLDFSTSVVNKVADVNQQFGFAFVQSNSGTVTNNQTIIGGNGLIYAPVTQTQSQSNAMAVSEIGRTFLS